MPITTNPTEQHVARGSHPIETLLHGNKIPSLASFLAGKPEQVIASNNPIIAITWLHTNEDHAPTVAHEIYSKHPELAKHINYICGNPLTAQTAPEKGFTHSDLNRNFDQELETELDTDYEKGRAPVVLDFVKNAKYVFDLHNTVCTNFGKIMIVSEEHFHKPRIQEMIAASPLTHILVMQKDICRKTLSGEKLGRTVTFEYELPLTKTDAIPDAIYTMKNLISGHIPHKPFERQIFRMIGTIPKTEDPGLDVKNFEPFTGADGKTHYAVFLGTGPRSYREDHTKDYCGYYATMERQVI